MRRRMRQGLSNKKIKESAGVLDKSERRIKKEQKMS